mmetsp:Transcript_36332/g.62981  ORF Transcript_36332/g.62981 Transcript_36332/m.62981 type:complete len:209 (+) Transcript_36332:1-627(+)
MGNKIDADKGCSKAESRRAFYLTMSEIPATISQFEEGLLESGFVVYQVFPLSPPGSRRVRRHLRASSDMADLFLAKEPRNSPLAAQPGTRERRSMSPREQDQIIRGLKPKGSKVPLAEGSRVKVKEEIIIRPSGEPVIPCITLTEVNGNHVVIQTNTVENHRRLLRHLNLVFKKSSRADRRASGNGLTVFTERSRSTSRRRGSSSTWQ